MREDYDEEFWEKHSVTRPADPIAAVDGFERLLDTNPPESAIQSFLEDFPWILSEQFPHCHFILPRFSMGGQYVTDFVAPERSSGGTMWMLIEIERSNCQLTTKTGDYAETVRHAIRQVKDWKRWLLDNQDLAARSRALGGLGLHDISRMVVGHVVVGRRSSVTPRFNLLREETLQNDRIEVKTYDRLLDWARKRAEFWAGYDRSCRSMFGK